MVVRYLNYTILLSFCCEKFSSGVIQGTVIHVRFEHVWGRVEETGGKWSLFRDPGSFPRNNDLLNKCSKYLIKCHRIRRGCGLISLIPSIIIYYQTVNCRKNWIKKTFFIAQFGAWKKIYKLIPQLLKSTHSYSIEIGEVVFWELSNSLIFLVFLLLPQIFPTPLKDVFTHFSITLIFLFSMSLIAVSSFCDSVKYPHAATQYQCSSQRKEKTYLYTFQQVSTGSLTQLYRVICCPFELRFLHVKK